MPHQPRPLTVSRTTRPRRAGDHVPRWRDDRGALTLFIAILFPALLAFAGLVLDTGTKLANYETASTIAAEAARAGADQVNQTQAYSNSTFVVDPSEARTAASEYLAAVPDVSGFTVETVGDTGIRVTVTVTTPTKILSIVGIDTVPATATATASLLSGVNGPGD
jgi:Flp pilus assembly protein TadG